MTAVLEVALPQDVQSCPALPEEAGFQEAMVALIVACNGFVYAGTQLDALIRIVRVLRARPDMVRALYISTRFAGPLRKTVPNEACRLGQWTDTEARTLAPAALMLATTCHGLLQSGQELDVQVRAIKFLRSRPDVAAALGLTGS